jgi:hypothetical protein
MCLSRKGTPGALTYVLTNSRQLANALLSRGGPYILVHMDCFWLGGNAL